MNLSDIKLKLFEVRITDVILHDCYGRHLGSKSTTDKDEHVREYKEKFYIIGECISEITNFLDKHKIEAVSITKLDIVLDARPYSFIE